MNQERVEEAIFSSKNFLASGVDSRVYKIPPRKGEELCLAKVYNRHLSRLTLFDYFTLTNRLASISEQENWTMPIHRLFGSYRLRVIPFSRLVIAQGHQVGIVPYIRSPRCNEGKFDFHPFLNDLSDYLNQRYSTENIYLLPCNVRKNPYTHTLYVTDLCASIAHLQSSKKTWLNLMEHSLDYE